MGAEGRGRGRAASGEGRAGAGRRWPDHGGPDPSVPGAQRGRGGRGQPQTRGLLQCGGARAGGRATQQVTTARPPPAPPPSPALPRWDLPRWARREPRSARGAPTPVLRGRRPPGAAPGQCPGPAGPAPALHPRPRGGLSPVRPEKGLLPTRGSCSQRRRGRSPEHWS